MAAFELRGLYAIADFSVAGGAGRLLELADCALAGGARLLQYRDKRAGAGGDKLAVARALRSLCRRHGALFLVNDDIELAAASAADGVHLGRDDGTVVTARERLPGGSLVGVSCYDDLRRAARLHGEGADYVAFGRLYPSASKPGETYASLALLRRAREELACPIAAIGGITHANSAPVVAAGADMLAVIGDLFAVTSERCRQNARSMSELFGPATGPTD